ncbi:MAG: hypothetical protein V4457_04990 [Pseudomonadota bacterium]|jgi:hypothetical protein
MARSSKQEELGDAVQADLFDKGLPGDSSMASNYCANMNFADSSVCKRRNGGYFRDA